MEQRRFSGKGHWYHETQSNHSQTDVLPLVPKPLTSTTVFCSI